MRTAEPIATGSRETAPSWCGSAFGLELRSRFALPGLTTGATPSSDSVVLELVGPAELAQAWGAGPATLLASLSDGDDALVLSIEAHEDRRYRLWGQNRGVFVIAADARRVLCAPDPEVASWTWQRFLIGQVLPLVASLHGIEIMHASAVEIAGAAVAFTGPPRSGKSSVAARMVVDGAPLIADDVVALKDGPDGLIAQPGMPLIPIRRLEWDRVDGDARAALGDVVAESEKEVLVVPARAHRRPVPLRSVYLLEATAAPSGTIRFEPVDDSRRLLASGFTPILRSPDELLRLLDVCARVSTSARLAWAIVPRSVDSAALARAIRSREEGAA